MAKDMAISLDMINRHYSEPNRNRYESKYFWEELYELICAAGFARLEIPYEPFWMFGGRSGVPMTAYSINTKYGNNETYLSSLKRAGIKHVQAISFESNLFMRNNQLGFYHGATGHFAGEALEHANALSAQYFIYSPTPYKGRTRHQHPDINTSLKAFKDVCENTLNSLADKAKELDITFCLKPEFWSEFTFDECMNIAARSNGKIKLAINTAHAHLMDINVLDILATQPQLVGYLQLSDTTLLSSAIDKDEPNPTHPAKQPTQIFCDVGKGNLDLKAILTARPATTGVSICNHQTRDPMRALLRNRAFLNAMEA